MTPIFDHFNAVMAFLNPMIMLEAHGDSRCKS